MLASISDLGATALGGRASHGLRVVPLVLPLRFVISVL